MFVLTPFQTERAAVLLRTASQRSTVLTLKCACAIRGQPPCWSVYRTPAHLPPPHPHPHPLCRFFLQALRISVWETADLFVDTSSVYFYVGTNSVYKSLAHEQPTDSSPHPPRLSSRSFPVYAWQGVSPVLSLTHCFAMEEANVLFCHGGGKLLALYHGEGKRIILPWRRQGYYFAMQEASVLFCHGVLPWMRQT